METPKNLNRVRFVWTNDTHTQVMAVEDPDGPFIMNAEYQGCIRYQPKTPHEKLVEAADAGEIPTAESPEIVRQWSSWSRAHIIPGGGIFYGGEVFIPPVTDILDYWYTEDRIHSCPKRIVVEGVLYNIPQPTEPPKEEEWGASKPLGSFTILVPTTESHWRWEEIPICWDNPSTETGLWRQFIPVYPGTFKWYWMKIKGWFARRK